MSIRLLIPALLLASDFTPLLYFLYGLTAIVEAALATVAFFATRGRSLVARAIAWGCVIALVATPTHTAGGNGTSNAIALFDILTSSIGGDPIYAFGALQRLALTIPVASLLVGVLLALARKRGPTA